MVDKKEKIKKVVKNENNSNVNVSGNAGRDINVDQSQTIYANSNVVSYKGEKLDLGFIEFLCTQILERFGYEKTIIGGIISFLIGSVGMFISVNSVSPLKYFPFLPQFPAVSIQLIVGSVVFILIGTLLWSLPEHKKSTRCSKCGEYYALKEYDNPDVKETKVKDGTRFNGTRYLRCSKCGNEETRQFSRFEKDEKEDSIYD